MNQAGRVGLLLLAAALCLPAGPAAKVLYREDFSGWRDERTEPGFQARLEVSPDAGAAAVTTGPKSKYGKVMSAEPGITLEVGENTTLEIRLLRDIPRGVLKIYATTAGEPYDSHQILETAKQGLHRGRLAEAVPWRGRHTFWLELWLEGHGQEALLGGLALTDGADGAGQAGRRKSRER